MNLQLNVKQCAAMMIVSCRVVSYVEDVIEYVHVRVCVCVLSVYEQDTNKSPFVICDSRCS